MFLLGIPTPSSLKVFDPLLIAWKRAAFSPMLEYGMLGIAAAFGTNTTSRAPFWKDPQEEHEKHPRKVRPNS